MLQHTHFLTDDLETTFNHVLKLFNIVYILFVDPLLVLLTKTGMSRRAWDIEMPIIGRFDLVEFYILFKIKDMHDYYKLFSHGQ